MVDVLESVVAYFEMYKRREDEGVFQLIWELQKQGIIAEIISIDQFQVLIPTTKREDNGYYSLMISALHIIQDDWIRGNIYLQNEQ
jgi:hypothetical protein